MLRTSHMPIWRACTSVVGISLLVSCGGSSSSAAAIPGLSVGGSYDTHVSLVEGSNTCGSVQVQDNPTTVDHQPGSISLSLTHAGNTYSGTVDAAGRFSTAVRRVGGQFDVSIAGQFSTSGFDATVQVAQVSPSCAYRVHWVGTKIGAPNTFP